MNSQAWKKEYQKINKSFKPKLVFRIGADAGFYSEFNNLILGVIYSLIHKINFNLQSEGDKIFYNKGWCDYFEPIFNETHYLGFKKYNVRPYMLKGRSFKYVPSILKKIYNISYLTQDLFDKFRTPAMNELYFHEPKLNLEGDLLNVSKVIIKHVYQFNTEIKTHLKKQIDSLNLPEDYIGVHIRHGDKVNETTIINTKLYLDYILRNFIGSCVFISTDNYETITELTSFCPELKIFTLEKPNESGYLHSEFINSSSGIRKDEIVKMLVNMEILTNAKYFLGTFDSNIGMFIKMRKGGVNCFDVMNREWKIW